MMTHSRFTPRLRQSALLISVCATMAWSQGSLDDYGKPIQKQSPPTQETQAQKNAKQLRESEAAADARKLADYERQLRAERQAREKAEEAAQVEKQKSAAALKELAAARAATPLAQPAPPAPSQATPTGLAAQRPGQPANLKAGATFTDSGGGIIAPVMVVIPPTGPGGFMMGSPASEKGDGNEKQHRVTLSQPFALSQKEVTWAQWEMCTSAGGCAVAGEDKPTPQWGTGQQPLIRVSWNQAMAYTQWLNTKLGFASTDPYRYRLPSEAEWEHAARAGNTGPFGFGKDSAGRERNISADLANYDATFSYNDSPKGKYWQQTREVGSYPPNAYGLYDMHGNVWEWVADCYEVKDNGDYDKLPDAVKNKGAAHRENDATCPYRVLRGGSWVNGPRNLRAAVRFRYTPTLRDDYVGFRLARMLPAGS